MAPLVKAGRNMTRTREVSILARLFFPLLLLCAYVAGQQPNSPAPTANAGEQDSTKPGLVTPAVAAPGTIVVPAGTKVPLVLVQAISTKTARPGDNVYAQTNFPLALNNSIVIPSGTYVEGTVAKVKRAGRMGGHAELLFAFKSLLFPNGYMVYLPGAVDNMPGMESGKMKDKEGTIEGPGKKGKDAATIGGTAATGGLIGLSAGARGAGIGAAAGGVLGLGIALATRNTEVRLPPGTNVEMVLQRPLVLEKDRLQGPADSYFIETAPVLKHSLHRHVPPAPPEESGPRIEPQ